MNWNITETTFVESLVILLVLLLVHPLCIFGDNKFCIDSGNSSKAPIAPSLDDASSSGEDFNVNDDVTLYCCFVSQYPVHVKWYKNNIPLVTGARYRFSEDNQVLPKAVNLIMVCIVVKAPTKTAGNHGILQFICTSHNANMLLLSTSLNQP
ncbi:uncharacterized protein LOC114524919 [Dendronephthya gigantea]|uniref:uncharacterized protein LOC114524919 n=1 Tax=Dendronephthya gigantea TaxID=151771 RepID=UPI00106AC023|nr:uncharacterized protein LOC114524919 [Dendronephthya gigantea]